MFMSRKFGSRSNRLAGYKGYLLGWNQLGNNKMSLQTDLRQINLKLFIQYQNTMLNLQLYHFSYVIKYDNYVIRRLHIIKLQPYLLSTVENIFQSWPLIGWDAYNSSSAIYHYCEIVTIFLTGPNQGLEKAKSALKPGGPPIQRLYQHPSSMKWLGVLLLPSPPWMGCWFIPRVPPPPAFHQTSQIVCQLQLDIPRISNKDLSPEDKKIFTQSRQVFIDLNTIYQTIFSSSRRFL